MGDITEDNPEETSESETGDITEDNPEETSENETGDVPEDIPEDIPEGIPEDIPEDVPEDIPEDVPEDIPEDIPEDVPEDNPEETSESETGDVIEDNPEETSENETGDVTEDNPEETSESETGDITEGKPENDINDNSGDEIEANNADFNDKDENVDETSERPSLKDLEKKEYFEAAKSSYDKAEEIANESELKYYKAHDLDGHISKVIEKSAEAADVIGTTTGNTCDLKDVAAAALYHDTGMDGGNNFEANDGDGIRKNHPLTSSIHVLQNRDALEADGCNADQVAALTLLHSKSCSGVRNLADNEQIEKAFTKLQTEVDEYNKLNPEKPIAFDASKIDKESFKYNAAALRLGDAYGHDSSTTKTQSGDYYDIDFEPTKELTSTIWDDNLWQEEIKDSKLTFYDNGEPVSINDTNDPSGYTRMYQFGEGNIESMGSKIGEGNEFQSVIDVKNGMAKPLCTQECILERLKELKTTNDLFPHSTVININGDCDDNHLNLYQSFANANEAEYGRIIINYKGGHT